MVFSFGGNGLQILKTSLVVLGLLLVSFFFISEFSQRNQHTVSINEYAGVAQPTNLSLSNPSIENGKVSNVIREKATELFGGSE